MALMFLDDEPPSYASSSASRRSSALPSPSYSRTPDRTESVLRTESDATCSAPDQYIYSSKSLTLDLGPKLWGTSIPVYGNNASVEGTLELKGDLKHVTSIELKLEGTVTNTYSERGMIAGCSSVEILSYKTSLPVTVQGETYTISVSFPSHALGRDSLLPPSAITYYPGVTCDVKYRLKVTLVKKGFRRNESIKVPLLYLPRTFAKAPLIESLPDILSGGSKPVFTPNTNIEGVKIVQVAASCNSGLTRSPPAVVVALPSSLSFSSYEVMPLSISLVSSDPAIVKLLQSSIKVHLMKRTRTWVQSSKNGSVSEALVGQGIVTRVDDSRSGATVTFYDLRAERSAVQKTWAISEVADQNYFVRVSIRPPTSTSAHVPVYDVCIPIEITTDSYDSPERELVANGGTPTPAIGTLAVGAYRQGHLSRQTFSRESVDRPRR